MSRATALTDEEREVDAYGVLGLTASATERDVQRAFRKMSLKYHPDKNADPAAVAVFHTLSLALNILSDPGKRLFLDSRLEKEKAQRARYAEMSKKRQAGVDDLLRREEAAKKARADAQASRQAAAEEEAVREAGRRMVEEAQRRARQAARPARPTTAPAPAPAPAASGSRAPAISPQDVTLRLQLPPLSVLDEAALIAALAKYGAVEHVVFRAPAAKAPEKEGKEGKEGKKKKGAVAVVEFAVGNWGGCWACWTDAERGQGVGGAKARWLAGETPAWVAWAEAQASGLAAANGSDKVGERASNGATGNEMSSAAQPRPAPSHTSASEAQIPQDPAASSGSALADLLRRHGAGRASAPTPVPSVPESFTPREMGGREESTLFRMRQRERERLEAQIRQEEGEA
ncbi:hypothetical protein Q5752_006227 [Cryptotrichosporon argae]